MFGQIAPRYDFLNHFLSGGVDYLWRRAVVRRARPNPDSHLKILDICTGTGDLAIAFWKRWRIPVVGGDFTPEMLEIAREKLKRLRITEERIQFVEADASSLPFRDGEFQIVSVAFGLRNIENTERGLSEMTRVCASGGQVAVLEFSLPTCFLFRWAYLLYFRRILPRIGQFVAKNQWEAYNYLPQSVQEFPQGEELAEMMRRAGLTDVQFFPMTFGIATLYVGRKLETTTQNQKD